MKRQPAPYGDCKVPSSFDAADNAYSQLYPVEYTASVSIEQAASAIRRELLRTCDASRCLSITLRDRVKGFKVDDWGVERTPLKSNLEICVLWCRLVGCIGFSFCNVIVCTIY